MTSCCQSSSQQQQWFCYCPSAASGWNHLLARNKIKLLTARWVASLANLTAWMKRKVMGQIDWSHAHTRGLCLCWFRVERDWIYFQTTNAIRTRVHVLESLDAGTTVRVVLVSCVNSQAWTIWQQVGAEKKSCFCLFVTSNSLFVPTLFSTLWCLMISQILSYTEGPLLGSWVGHGL
jgi:hypothetical protein